jgi:cytochrome c5
MKSLIAALVFLLLPIVGSSAQTPAPAKDSAAISKAAAATLPNAPEKALVMQLCDKCHTLDLIVRSGGTLDGWTDRLQRMIRAGAAIPQDQIPAIAAYLAKSLPPRPRPQTPQR